MKGQNKLRQPCSTVILCFAVVVPCCTFPPLDVCPMQSIKSLKKENLEFGRTVLSYDLGVDWAIGLHMWYGEQP